MLTGSRGPSVSFTPQFRERQLHPNITHTRTDTDPPPFFFFLHCSLKKHWVQMAKRGPHVTILQTEQPPYIVLPPTSSNPKPPYPGIIIIIIIIKKKKESRAEHLLLPICACVGCLSEVHGGWWEPCWSESGSFCCRKRYAIVLVMLEGGRGLSLSLSLSAVLQPK